MTDPIETSEVQEQTTEEAKAEEVEAKSTDWKAEARKWEARAKENRQRADEFEEYKTKTQTELERAKSGLKKAKDELAKLNHDKEVGQWANEISKETGVPEAVLVAISGETREDIQAQADKLKPYFEQSPAPVVGTDKGVSNSLSEVGELTSFANKIF